MSKYPKFTLGSLRDQLRQNRLTGDALEALHFLMKEYDQLWTAYRRVANPQEYTVYDPAEVVGHI